MPVITIANANTDNDVYLGNPKLAFISLHTHLQIRFSLHEQNDLLFPIHVQVLSVLSTQTWDFLQENVQYYPYTNSIIETSSSYVYDGNPYTRKYYLYIKPGCVIIKLPKGWTPSNGL